VKLPFGLDKYLGGDDPDQVEGSAADKGERAGETAGADRGARSDAVASRASAGAGDASGETRGFPAPTGERAAPQSVGVPKKTSRWSRGSKGGSAATTTGPAESPVSEPTTQAEGDATQAFPAPEKAAEPAPAETTVEPPRTASPASDTETQAIPREDMPVPPKNTDTGASANAGAQHKPGADATDAKGDADAGVSKGAATAAGVATAGAAATGVAASSAGGDAGSDSDPKKPPFVRPAESRKASAGEPEQATSAPAESAQTVQAAQPGQAAPSPASSPVEPEAATVAPTEQISADDSGKNGASKHDASKDGAHGPHTAAAIGGGIAGGAGLGALLGSSQAGGDTTGGENGKSTASSTEHIRTAEQEGSANVNPQSTPEQATTAFPMAGADYGFVDAPEDDAAYADSVHGANHGSDYGTVGAAPAEKPRRGTADFGLFVLRIAVAALLGLHGLRIAFGLFDGPGTDGMAEVLSSAGFDSATTPLAYGLGAAALVGAVLLILGLVAPLAVTILLAFVALSALIALGAADSTTILGGSDLSGAPGGGLELHIVYAAALVALLFAGGGKWGFDAGRKWAAAPKWSGFAGIIVAAVAVGLIWYFLNGTNPIATT